MLNMIIIAQRVLISFEAVIPRNVEPFAVKYVLFLRTPEFAPTITQPNHEYTITAVYIPPDSCRHAVRCHLSSFPKPLFHFLVYITPQCAELTG